MLISLLIGSGDLVEKLYTMAFMLISIVLSLSVHEWAHAYAAHRMGDDTAKVMGRMTLNPLAHLDPTGFFLLLIAGFGWAKPVPVSSRNYRNPRVGEFVVSFAGIFMNLMLALFSAICLVAVLLITILGNVSAEAQTTLQMLSFFFYLLGIINCSLAIFNLLPIYPLDGSHLFELFFGKLLGPQPIMWLRRYGSFILIGVLVLSTVMSNTAGISPIAYLSEGLFGLFQKLFLAIANLFI